MAYLVGPTGHVYGIEHVQGSYFFQTDLTEIELVDQSILNITVDNASLLDRITILKGDGLAGLPEHAPFDVIYVGAAASGKTRKNRKSLTSNIGNYNGISLN